MNDWVRMIERWQVLRPRLITLRQHKIKGEDAIAILERSNAILRRVLFALVLGVVLELAVMIFVVLALINSNRTQALKENPVLVHSTATVYSGGR
jgi:hypothetical protein